ncbi:hypothetical protein TW95_gp0115 [Pandoravirus inopinatum]|uniref:DUF5860 domain-containing protein n=1 Tax=Pandoravirus inopinatum TaxID=1605721 RepID=A0A0B5J083_9VIRU|nr:hypothetical protein TW95_gp0115 [Pandoravirus inopinatum]AJF96849.1 hypothetical protein [Pandoravirus inopinatum]
MTCPPTFAAPVPSDATEVEAPSLPADLFMRMYPWMSAGDACLYAAVDRDLADKVGVSLPGIVEGVLRRQWTAEPLVGDNVETVTIDYEPNGPLGRDKWGIRNGPLRHEMWASHIASSIFMDYAVLFDEESHADVWSGHRLVLSVAANNRYEVRFKVEYVGAEDRRVPARPRDTALTTVCPGMGRTARQMALAVDIDAALATVPHNWVGPLDDVFDGADRSPIDHDTLDLHVRHVIAEAHRRGVRYSPVPRHVTLSIYDDIGRDGGPLFAFIVCHDDDDSGDDDNSVGTGRTRSTQWYATVRPSVDRTFLVATPSSQRRRTQGTPWQAVHKTDNTCEPLFGTGKQAVAAPAERRWVPCGDRAVFGSHRASSAKRDTNANDDTRADRDRDNDTIFDKSERRAVHLCNDPPPLSSTLSTPTQTVADIVALYPDLTADQAARVFAASAQLDGIPYVWVAIEAFGQGRCMATSLRASAAAMLRVKSDYHEAAWYAGRRVVLALGDARDTILYRIVGRAPEAKTQTNDDLAALYPHLSPIELMGVGAINRALKDVPHVWVGGAGLYPHRVSLGPGGPPVTATIEAVRRLYDHAAASRLVLALGRTPAGALTLNYGAVLPRR